jgi:hypothetical protein
VNDELEGMWKEAVLVYVKILYYLGICLEGPRITTKKLSQDSRSQSRYLNPRPPEYEAGLLTSTFGLQLLIIWASGRAICTGYRSFARSTAVEYSITKKRQKTLCSERDMNLRSQHSSEPRPNISDTT